MEERDAPLHAPRPPSSYTHDTHLRLGHLNTFPHIRTLRSSRSFQRVSKPSTPTLSKRTHTQDRLPQDQGPARHTVIPNISTPSLHTTTHLNIFPDIRTHTQARLPEDEDSNNIYFRPQQLKTFSYIQPKAPPQRSRANYTYSFVPCISTLSPTYEHTSRSSRPSQYVSSTLTTSPTCELFPHPFPKTTYPKIKAPLHTLLSPHLSTFAYEHSPHYNTHVRPLHLSTLPST